MTPTTRQALLGTDEDIAWRRTIPPEDRPPAMRVHVALADALDRIDELEAEANGGYRVLLRDCDTRLATALQAAEIGAFPGPAWREGVRQLRATIKEVCGE